MAGRGRPLKLTPEVQKKLLDAIRAGNYYEPACAFAGVDYSTFRRWMRVGEKARKGRFRDFYQEVKKAEAEAEARMVLQWQKQMPGNWPAIRDFLERRYPERWGRRSVDVSMKQEVSGQVELKHDGSIALDLASSEGFLRAVQEAVSSGEATSDLGSLPGSVDSGQDRGTPVEEADGDPAGFGSKPKGGGSQL
jgi:hypothetical protein